MSVALAPAPVPAAAPTPTPWAHLRLVVPRAEALRVLQAQFDRGMQIKKSRIRYVPELEKARAAKGDWTAKTATVLEQVFDTRQIADEYQAWVGRVLPEYADLNLFIEHFYDEMDQRLRRLALVMRKVQELPEAATPGRSVGEASTGASAATAEAQIAGEPANASRPAPVAIASPVLASPATAKAPPAAPPVVPSRASRPSPVRDLQSPTEPVGEPDESQPTALLLSHTADPRAQQAVEAFLIQLGLPFTTLAVSGGDGGADSGVCAHFEAHPTPDVALLVTDPASPVADFDLGYLAGRLGHRRVLVLATGAADADVKHPVARLTMDPGDGWQLQLGRHLRRAGLAVDLNRLA